MNGNELKSITVNSIFNFCKQVFIFNINLQNMQGSQYTIEDMYIDDEFGSKLNYNLILLDDNIVLSDDESLPQTTEL